MVYFKKSFRFLVFCFSVLFVSEGILRIMQPRALQYYRDVKLVHTFHPEVGVTLATNHKTYIRHHTGLWQGKFETNSLGHRATKEIDPSLPKIVCLGDSLVMGFGVSDEDTFCSLLDGISLNGKKHQSVNLGVDAYGSLGFYKRLKDQLPFLPNTKKVLLFVSPNDFAMPEALAKQGLLPDDEIDSLHENDPVWKKSFYLQFEATRFSYLLQALKLAWEQNKLAMYGFKARANNLTNSANSFSIRSELKSAFISERSPCDAKITLNSKNSCPEPIPESRFTCPLASPSLAKDLEPLPKVTQEAYLKIIALSKSYGFQLIPVFVPSQIEEIYCEMNGKYHPLGDYAIRANDFFIQHKISPIRLMPFAKNMCALNLKSNIAEKGIENHFLPGDGHLTKLGNRWVYESLKIELENFK